MIIFVSARWAKTAFTAERDKFKLSTMRTAKHSATLGSIAAKDHAVDIFHDGGPGMKEILNLFIVVSKNGLENVFIMHKNILQ